MLIDFARPHAMAKRPKRAEAMIQRYLGGRPAPPVPMRACATVCAAKFQRMRGHTQRPEALLPEARKLDSDCRMFFRQPHHGLFGPP